MRTVLVVGELGEGDVTPEVGGEERVCFRNLNAGANMSVRLYRVDTNATALTAAKVAFKKLPIVAVEPLDCV